MGAIEGNGWSGERRRLSSGQVRTELLETARGLITEHGLSVSFDHIQLEELIRLANVPRSSVYRIWPNRMAFLEDLLDELFVPDSGRELDLKGDILAGAEATLSANTALLTSAEGRARLLCELVRVASQRNYEALAVDPGWGTYNTLLAAASGNAAAGIRAALIRSVARMEDRSVARMEALYERMLPVLGRRMKPGLSTRKLALLGSCLAEGLARHYALRPGLVADEIAYSPAGCPEQPWQLIGIGFLQLAEGMTEEDPASPLNL